MATRRFLLLNGPGDHLDQRGVPIWLADGLPKRVGTLPANLRRSLTCDQAKEMAEHVRFSVDTGVAVYFCNPKSHRCVDRLRTQRHGSVPRPGRSSGRVRQEQESWQREQAADRAQKDEGTCPEWCSGHTETLHDGSDYCFTASY